MVRRKVFILILIFIFIMGSAALGMAKMRTISTQQAHDVIEERDGDSDFVILDVRTPTEYDEGHIENAINMDFYVDAFPDELDGLDRDNTYLIYCRSSSRSGSTFKMMRKLGFKDVFKMEGGIEEWSLDYPVVE